MIKLTKYFNILYASDDKHWAGNIKNEKCCQFLWQGSINNETIKQNEHIQIMIDINFTVSTIMISHLFYSYIQSDMYGI